ncbi:hypothetical protein K7X08_002457 [Anisodus acutangulus]|uniref:Uncharacterized protein n=1 Tax=Anisodus acutangulus TaxID=402998 RepID=A0A9Q1R7A4_9SOLA|nr:hypothetical protein K7X08_002457 [Anisodus acutangulus]
MGTPEKARVSENNNANTHSTACTEKNPSNSSYARAIQTTTLKNPKINRFGNPEAEYAYVMRVTEAGNMYSFEVIMLELLTGKPAISEGTELAKSIFQHEDLAEVLDSRVSGNSVQVHQQMLLLLQISLQCLSISPSERPDAKELLETLLLLGQEFGI